MLEAVPQTNSSSEDPSSIIKHIYPLRASPDLSVPDTKVIEVALDVIFADNEVLNNATVIGIVAPICGCGE